MKQWLTAALLGIFLSSGAGAHVVTRLFGEWKETPGSWEMEVLFEAGYAEPAIRDDPKAAAPDREWLLGRGEEGWERLRAEAERYFRESMRIRSSEKDVTWRVEFPDFAKSPPDFPVLLNDGAYMRMVVRPVDAPDGPVTLFWSEGERPTLTLKMPGADGGYLTFNAGDRREIAFAAKKRRGVLSTSFRQGFMHVIPQGWDHVLFVLGLFFYRRKWRPLLDQSLAFTAAHTVTLGLAAAGVVKVSGNWVEPMIAISLVAVALENLRTERAGSGYFRLLTVFGFGLVHGLGFAGALSVWLRPGEGFLPSLLSANLGVEVAQASLLAVAWGVTIGWNETRAYRITRMMACLGIAATGAYWAVDRIM